MPPDPVSVPAEPTPALLARPLWCSLQATRPAFLSVTGVAVVLGWAVAWHGNPADPSLAGGTGGVGVMPLLATVTLMFALVAHGAANVLNDYYDARSGCDAANRERLFPFTGGSRFIQNGVFSEQRMARLGYGLLLAVVPAGLWLAVRTGPQLLPLGLAGLILAWAYSAPPLRLASRGLGELAVSAGWTLVVAGSAQVQGWTMEPGGLLAAVSYGAMVANLLFINQFPDATADGQSGKRTLVVRWGRRRAVAGYAVLVLLAMGLLLAGILIGRLPLAAAWAALALIPASRAFRDLVRHADSPSALRPAIIATIVAAHLHGMLLAVSLAIF